MCLDSKKTWSDYAEDLESVDEFFKGSGNGNDYGDGGPEASID